MAALKEPANPPAPSRVRICEAVKVEVHDRLEAIGPSAWEDLVASSRLRVPFLSYTWQSG